MPLLVLLPLVLGKPHVLVDVVDLFAFLAAGSVAPALSDASFTAKRLVKNFLTSRFAAEE